MIKISVLTPSFNSGNYIERAIQSVLDQKYENCEHIIMDGGSTDQTISILEKYPHLLWISEKDKGQADAMNKAFDKSTGDIIVYLNADDYFEKDAFISVIKQFDSDPSFDMLVGNGTHIHADGTSEIWNSEVSYSKCLQFYKYQFPMNPVSYFYKRHVQEQIAYNVDNHYAMDYEFILRAYQLFKIKKIEQLLGFFWEDGNNKTSNTNAYKNLKDTALAHCFKYDKVRLLIYVPYFIKRKILRLDQ